MEMLFILSCWLLALVGVFGFACHKLTMEGARDRILLLLITACLMPALIAEVGVYPSDVLIWTFAVGTIFFVPLLIWRNIRYLNELQEPMASEYRRMLGLAPLGIQIATLKETPI